MSNQGGIITAELFDIIDENGNPTGKTVTREFAHTNGVLHKTVHIWLFADGKILLQKRSPDKDSFPNCYDISSAGHIDAGESDYQTALRELSEELGINAAENQLEYIGEIRKHFSGEFHGRKFVDNELASVYIFHGEVDINTLSLQTTELSEVKLFSIDECLEMSKSENSPININEIMMIKKYMGSTLKQQAKCC